LSVRFPAATDGRTASVITGASLQPVVDLIVLRRNAIDGGGKVAID